MRLNASSMSVNHADIQRPRFWLYPNQEKHLFSFSEEQCQSASKTETRGPL